MKFTIQGSPFGGYDFYIFEDLSPSSEHEVNLAQPVKLVMKKCPVGGKMEPTFSIPSNFLEEGIEDSLKKIMKQFKIGDDEHELRGLVKGKDEHIKYLEGLIDKLINKSGVIK